MGFFRQSHQHTDIETSSVFEISASRNNNYLLFCFVVVVVCPFLCAFSNCFCLFVCLLCLVFWSSLYFLFLPKLFSCLPGRNFPSHLLFYLPFFHFCLLYLHKEMHWISEGLTRMSRIFTQKAIKLNKSLVLILYQIYAVFANLICRPIIFGQGFWLVCQWMDDLAACFLLLLLLEFFFIQLL